MDVDKLQNAETGSSQNIHRTLSRVFLKEAWRGRRWGRKLEENAKDLIHLLWTSDAG